ncbi:MAG: post-transcriptional regulator [Bacilli bacterium]|nr:post-transcriptional regulator [Bacilli bacterium]
MDIEFKSLNELYIRIKPALLSKKHELHRGGMTYIKEEDIWNCLRETKWCKTSNLSLSEIVDDILNVDNYLIEKYVQQKIKDVPREVNFDQMKTLFNGEE